MNFQPEIITWYLNNKRDLPWRNTSDAYIIWLSEIILQQTRVEQGLPYFNRFLNAFPTVQDLAAASESEVLKLWEGLGYYSRGRNMLHTARAILERHDGIFPTQYDTLINLKGIGDYTAAAISSFAANESRAVLDGNVFRVLARYFGIDTPINSPAGKKTFSALADELIQRQNASVYNQAIMEFGALQCKPKSPLCETCPLRQGCFAFNHKQTQQLPVKLKPAQKRVRHFNYFVAEQNGQVLMKQRAAGDIWQQLYDFPLVETSAEHYAVPEEFAQKNLELFGFTPVLRPVINKKHVLTHQIIYVQFFALDNNITNFNTTAGFKWLSRDAAIEAPKPNVINDFVKFYLTKL
jgi:A/G-specific adenine glycosylase